MSRVGKMPIKLPSGVKVAVKDEVVLVEGPKGKLETPIPKGISVEVSDSTVKATRRGDEPRRRALHGLTRTLLANSVLGVTKGFSKELDVVGIGYKAEIRGKYLNLSLGFSHPIEIAAPPGIQITVERQPRQIQNYVATIKVAGIDKYQVGQVAADLRRLRPPDAYKGKGIRYANELVRLKAGKKNA